jgi:hypothetical protein
MDTNKLLFRLFLTAGILVTMHAVSGCAGINPLDAPKTIIENPLGTDSIRVGMSKERVTSIWGKPDQINMLKPADEWQTAREEWVYKGRYTKIPLNRSYLFKDKYLIFDGNNLVCVGDETQCKADPEE